MAPILNRIDPTALKLARADKALQQAYKEADEFYEEACGGHRFEQADDSAATASCNP